MLHFWKKSGINYLIVMTFYFQVIQFYYNVLGQKQNSHSNSPSPTKSTCSNTSFGNSNESKTASIERLQTGPALSLEDEGLFDTGIVK